MLARFSFIAPVSGKKNPVMIGLPDYRQITNRFFFTGRNDSI